MHTSIFMVIIMPLQKLLIKTGMTGMNQIINKTKSQYGAKLLLDCVHPACQAAFLYVIILRVDTDPGGFE